ncbi:MAG: hypothetical protein HOW73_07825 [Polyangiaceae bacterium]|nr:hypothetical protein [Polyangiaceae bacterium]
MIAKTKSTSPVVPANRFMTPAGQIDFPDDPVKQSALDSLWNTNLSGFTAQGITGNPWTSTYSSDQTWYYDPTTTNTSDAQYAQITWSPLPGRIAYYFHSLANTPDLFSLADTGKDTKGNTFGTIPSNPCDPDGTSKSYGPYGPRGWQDEYCEWSIERDSKGRIVRIDYTCENPEYYNSLWMIDPNRVLEVYRTTLDKPQIAIEDLYLRDSSGNVIIDAGTGRPAYDPLNKWNSGPISTSTGGGAMHLTSTPNTIQTEIGLGSTATTPRTCGNTSIGTLICCAQYGQIGRNSDPNIGAQVNRLVSNGSAPMKVTLANPPGLYMQTPDFTRFVTPDKTNAAEFWTVKRGNPSLVDSLGRTLPGTFVLHATFMVPASKGYTISDIMIDGIPILYASQVNQTFLMQICGQANPQPPPFPSVQPCAGTPTSLVAQPLQLFQSAVFSAMYAQTYSTVVGVDATLASNSTLIAPWIAPGASNVAMTLVVGAIDPNNPPTVSFGDDVTVTTGAITSVTYAIPGNSYPSQNYAMALTVSVAKTAAPGLRGCLVTNPGQQQSIPCPALLDIRA